MGFPAVDPAYTESTRAIQLLQQRTRKATVVELKKTYLYYRLMVGGNVLNVNGPAMELPFYVAPPQMGRWMGKTDSLPDATSTKLAMGFATNRYLAVPMSWDLLDQWENESNPNKIFDLLDLKSQEQAWALRRSKATALWSGIGGKQPDGISTMIEAAAPSAQTAVVLGVDKATKAWARNGAIQLTSDFGNIGSGTSIPAGFLAIMSLIDTSTIGTMRPSDLITKKNVFDTIRRALLEVNTPYHMVSDVSMSEWGFEQFRFNGVHIAWDPDCPDDKMYALHIDENYDPKVTNDPRDKAKLDADLEDLGVGSFFELSGGVFLIRHPRVSMRQIAPRSPMRQLTESSWIMDSMNVGIKRPSDCAVLYSDNGSRLSTW